MKTTRFFSAFAALVLGTASFSALSAYAEDEETMYGDIRYSGALNSELGIYAGDTLDCSRVILEAVMYDWEGKASYVYSFTVGSGEFAELYTLDTTQVDTETPGDYHIVIRPAAGENGSFPYKSISPVQYHDLCMKGTESAIPVKVYDKDSNADTPLYLRCYKEYIEMNCSGGVMIPLVGAYPAKTEYEVEDETIARVEKSSTAQNLVLWGLREGETTVTVRTSDGRTATEKIRVLPAIVTETEPPILTTTPDPATTTTKWWYQYETTEPEQTSTAVWKEVTTKTTVTDEKGRILDENGNVLIINGTSAVVTGSITDIMLPDADWGDANCDNNVDVLDAVLTARFAAEDHEAILTKQGKLNADMNHDGNLTGDDVTAILRKIAKLK